MRALLMTLCIGIAAGLPVTAQEPADSKVESKKAETVDSKSDKPENLVSSEEVLSSFQKSGLDFNQTIYSEAALSTLNIDTNNTVEKIGTNDLTRIELQRVQITGTLTPAVKTRTFGSFLQLFNPFAPVEYGGTGTPEGKAPSRAFMDPVTTQPSSPLIGVGNRPKKTDD